MDDNDGKDDNDDEKVDDEYDDNDDKDDNDVILSSALGCVDQEDYYQKYGRDYWMKDIDQYDMLCKVSH